MKRMAAWLMVAAMMVAAVGCSSKPAETTKDTEAPKATEAVKDTEPAAPVENETKESVASADRQGTEDIDFKIGIICTPLGSEEEYYREAMALQEKYGEDVILVDTYPSNASTEQEVTISKALAMAADPDVKAIIFAQAQVGTIASINKVKEVRPDIFCVTVLASEDVDEITSVADLLFQKDEFELGRQIAQKAKDAGAETVIHYSFPRHMANAFTAGREQIIRETCEANGIEYVFASFPDPEGDAGVSGAQQALQEDIYQKVNEYGENTAFFDTNSDTFETMIKACIDTHSIYLGQADPSPFANFPSAMNIAVPDDKKGDNEWMLNELSKRAAELGMSGKLSCWTAPVIVMAMDLAVDYSIQHVKGTLNESEGVVDLEYTAARMKEMFGSDTVVNYMTTPEGVVYKNFISLIGQVYVF